MTHDTERDWGEHKLLVMASLETAREERKEISRKIDLAMDKMASKVDSSVTKLGGRVADVEVDVARMKERLAIWAGLAATVGSFLFALIKYAITGGW